MNLFTPQHDRQQAQQLGTNEFITKPMNAELLGQVVARLRVDWLEVNAVKRSIPGCLTGEALKEKPD